jgi:hypothetical protein
MAEQFLQEVRTHQYTSAYQLTSAKYRNVTTLQSLQQLWKMMEIHKGTITGWTLKSHSASAGTSGSYTVLVYQVQGSKGSGTAVFRMIENGDVWQVEGTNFGD